MIWSLLIIGYVVAVAAVDLGWRRIPNLLTVPAILIGLAAHLWFGSFLASAIATVAGFAGGLAFFHLGAIGGGDVKLVASLGALLGAASWAHAMVFTIFAAGLLAIAQICWHGAFRRTASNLRSIVFWHRFNGLQPHPEMNVQNQNLMRSPFGVAAAIGTALQLVLA